MKKEQHWFQRQRKGLWHLRKGGLKGYREWQDRLLTSEEASTASYDKPIATTIVSDIDLPVIAGIATMPSRVPLLENAFNSIYWQVDEVYVFLNNFHEVPSFLERPGVKIFRSQDFEDYKDVGKFFALRQVDRGILFTVDDDILYPPDYVSKLLSYLAATGFRAAIGVHGFQLPKFPKSFFDRRMFHFRRKLESLAFASVLGTGTLAFDIESLGLSFEDFTSYGMADIHVAAYLKGRNIPAMVVPRVAGWLMPLSAEELEDQSPTLYDQTIANGAVHNKILRSNSPWGEEDVLRRWHKLGEDQFLSHSLASALHAIENARLDDSNVFKDVPTNSIENYFKNLKPWLEIYGDSSTKLRVSKDALAVPSLGQSAGLALDTMWRNDTTKAIEASRILVKDRDRDFRVLRQHANLCAGFFLFDEAEQSFAKAIRLAGAKDEKATFSILLEYFRFLIRYEEYEKAQSIAFSLETKYGENPAFQASMVIVHLSKADTEGAATYLTALVESERNGRESAMASLVRQVAEIDCYSESASGLVSEKAIVACKHSAEDLVILLKIATIFGDVYAATSIWQYLEDNHQVHLEEHPQLVLFYASNWDRSSSLLNGTLLEALIGVANDTPYALHRHITDFSSRESPLLDGPLVSVILTAFNSEETIDYAVQSILQQTYRNLELIIVDDQSRDRTAERAEAWRTVDSRISVIRNGTNMGPYASRNIGLRYARGSFVAIQDADDVSLPSRLVKQMRSFTDDTQAVLGEHVRVDAGGSLHLENDGSVVGHGPVTLVVRRAAIDEIGAFSDVRTRGDKEFESRLVHFYGEHSLLRVKEIVVFALFDPGTNSHIQTGTSDKKRDLMLFKETYTRDHSNWEFTTTDP